MKENNFTLQSARSRQYHAETITDADYADYQVFLINTPAQAKFLLHNLEQTATGISLYVNADKTESMCFNHAPVIKPTALICCWL